MRNDFVTYLTESVSTYTRYTLIRFKVSCNKDDKELVDPVMHAVRRHYAAKQQLIKTEFRKFKRRSVKLLFMSLAMVMLCHGVLPMVVAEGAGIAGTITNSIDVFSWVILWKPIDRLIFYWNPFLKEISLYDKLENAEVIVMEYASTAVELENKLRASA